MTDTISKSKRSWVMSRIGSKNTAPEKRVRSMLHAMGYRFRLHRKELPGKPDITLAKHKTVIFVHGCFWHRHENCSKNRLPKSNVDFWRNKFEKNVERDERVVRDLRALGWRVEIIWECETVDEAALESRLKSIFEKRGGKIIYEKQDDTTPLLPMVAENALEYRGNE